MPDRDKVYRDLEAMCDAIDDVATAASPAVGVALLSRASTLKFQCMQARGIEPPVSPWSGAMP